MDPATIAILVTAVGALVVSCIDLIVNLYVGFKQRHFHSECLGCILDYDSTTIDEGNKK